jgi:mRNA-degrading endonuclease RelE of RelBE toxin-antitoxin system
MPSPRSNRSFLVCAGVERYKLLLKASVLREYEAIASKADRRRILWKIAALAVNPRCAEASKLPESEDHYRICLVRHRIIFRIDDPQRQVTVFRIAHRRPENSTW